MAEQIILQRHGESWGNLWAQGEGGYVQGPLSDLTELGRRQVEASAHHLGQLIMQESVLPPDLILASKFARVRSTAGIFQKVLSEQYGLPLKIVIDSALEEKREPRVLEDRTGKEIASDPLLRAVKQAIDRQDLNDKYTGRSDIDITGYETWPQVLNRSRAFLRRIVTQPDNPLVISSAGTLGCLQALREHGLQLQLGKEITAEELFNNYLFKFGNAQGMVYQHRGENWEMIATWTCPDQPA